jgi:hypothetical protein
VAISNDKFARSGLTSFADRAPASVGEGVNNAPEAGSPLVHDVVIEMRARMDELEHRVYVLEDKQKGAADE